MFVPNLRLRSAVRAALIQVAAVAVFGGGASRDPYNAISDPKKFTKYLGQVNVTLDKTYLGWGYWMAVVGAMLSVASGVLFIVTSLCKSKDFD